MNDISDAELLKAFASRQQENAFAELVRRYGSLVYGATLRRTGDHSLAEETAQNVFATLARRSGELATHPALAAWLQKTAAFEALRAMEKESNRRRLMHEYSRELSMPDAAEEPWHAALPLLDSAIATLPEADRQLLLLRYWQEQPYKKIAETVGSTVGACEKRAERALEKLSGILRKKGAAISALVLATGLTSALTKAQASPLVLGRITSSALVAAKTAPAASGFLTTLLIMKSKFTPAILLAALVLLSATSGWVAGRVAHPSAPKADPEPNPSAAANASLSDPTGGKKPVDPVLKAHHESLHALLEAAQRDLSTADYDPAAKARAAARIASIAPQDIRQALEFADELIKTSGDSSPLAAMILGRWAEFDGLAACEAALPRREPFLAMPSLAEPVKVWAARDPQAAFHWYLAKAAASESVKRDGERWKPISSLRWIMGAWSLRDMDGAVRAFSSLKDKTQIDGAMVGFQEMSGQAPGRTAILDAFLAQTQDKTNVWTDFHGILRQWSSHQPAELASWLDECGVPKSSHDSLASPILTGWQRADSKAAMDWWFQAPGGYPDRAHRMETLINAWTEADVFAAAEWLAAQPLDATAASSMKTLAGKIAQSDPERGWTWALSIPAEGPRNDALRQVASNWGQKDKKAAEEAINASPLNDAEKTEILKLIKTP